MNNISFDNDVSLGCLDKFISSSNRGTSKTKKSKSSLDLNRIKGFSKEVDIISDDKIKIRLKNRNISASQVVRILKSSNVNIYQVDYSDELEDNDLINVSDKPLWRVSKESNGVFVLERNF